MKFPQLVSTPALVKDWLDSELDALGIDAAVYTRYILSILQKDILDPLDEQFADSLLMQEAPSRQRGRKRTRKRRKRQSWSSEEDMKKSAAVDCLRSVSDQNLGLEKLVDELCVKLKSLQCEDGEASAAVSENQASSDSEAGPATPEEQAKQYYAAFPPLSDEVQSPVDCQPQSGSVWDAKVVRDDVNSPEVKAERKSMDREEEDQQTEAGATASCLADTEIQKPLVPFFKLGEVWQFGDDDSSSLQKYQNMIPVGLDDDDSEPEVENVCAAVQRPKALEDTDTLDGYNGDTSSRESSEDREKPAVHRMRITKAKKVAVSPLDHFSKHLFQRVQISEEGMPCKGFTLQCGNFQIDSLLEPRTSYQLANPNTLAALWHTPPPPFNKNKKSTRASADYRPKSLLLQFQALGETTKSQEDMLDVSVSEDFMDAANALTYTCIKDDQRGEKIRSPISILSPSMDCLLPDHLLIPGISDHIRGLLELIRKEQEEEKEKLVSERQITTDRLRSGVEANSTEALQMWYEEDYTGIVEGGIDINSNVWSTSDSNDASLMWADSVFDASISGITSAEKNLMVDDLESMMLEIDQAIRETDYEQECSNEGRKSDDDDDDDKGKQSEDEVCWNGLWLLPSDSSGELQQQFVASALVEPVSCGLDEEREVISSKIKDLEEMLSNLTNSADESSDQLMARAQNTLKYSEETSSFSVVQPRLHPAHTLTVSRLSSEEPWPDETAGVEGDNEIDAEISKEMFATIEKERHSHKDDDENLLVSPRTHFRPIRQDSVDHYEDGTVFEISHEPETFVFTRSSSGSMLLQNEVLGGATPQKYMMYNWPRRAEETDLLEDEHVHHSVSEQLPPDGESSPLRTSFVPKFKKSKAEKFCQTEEQSCGEDTEWEERLDKVGLLVGSIKEDECLISHISRGDSDVQKHVIETLQKTIQNICCSDDESSPAGKESVATDHAEEVVQWFLDNEDSFTHDSLSLLISPRETIATVPMLPFEIPLASTSVPPPVVSGGAPGPDLPAASSHCGSWSTAGGNDTSTKVGVGLSDMISPQEDTWSFEPVSHTMSSHALGEWPLVPLEQDEKWPSNEALASDPFHLQEMREEIQEDGEELFAALGYPQDQNECSTSPEDRVLEYESAVPIEYASSYPSSYPIDICGRRDAAPEYRPLEEGEEAFLMALGSCEAEFFRGIRAETETPGAAVKLSCELEQEWRNDQDVFGLPQPKNDCDRCRPSRRPCSFYMEGHCNRRDCRFAHDLSTITCRFWEEGSCFKGITCPFLHGYTDCSQKPTKRPCQPKVKKGFEINSEKDFPSLSSSAESKETYKGRTRSLSSSNGKSSSLCSTPAKIVKRRMRRTSHRSGVARKKLEGGGGEEPSSSEDFQQHRHSSGGCSSPSLPRQKGPQMSRRRKRKSAGDGNKGAPKEPF